MCAKLSFDASKVAPSQPMDPVPKGWYPVVVIESDIVPTKTDPKEGRRLELTVEIIDGEFKGRKAWDGLNTKNKNPQAQKIGEEQLSALCHATGVIKMADTNELHGKPFEIKLGLEGERQSEDGKSNYDARNVFKGFRALEGATGTASATNTGAATGAPPQWLKKPGAGAPAAPGKPGAPAKPAPAPAEPTGPASAAEAAGANAESKFWVVGADGNVGDETMTGAEIAAALGDGMPEDTQIMLDGTEEWKTPADFEIAPFTEPAAAPAAPAKPTAPAKPKGPAAPAPAAGKKAPWKK